LREDKRRESEGDEDELEKHFFEEVVGGFVLIDDESLVASL
jgi:hypothetical protein